MFCSESSRIKLFLLSIAIYKAKLQAFVNSCTLLGLNTKWFRDFLRDRLKLDVHKKNSECFS